nr:MAG TPA: hypothetical protein [Caudoviricetes sp.]DAP60732.1 MAG TPA: hypothetical protein [Caudoviricetes sp.]
MCCCRIPFGSSARPTDITQRRSGSTSLKSCRRAAHLNRDNKKRLRAGMVQRRCCVYGIML